MKLGNFLLLILGISIWIIFWVLTVIELQRKLGEYEWRNPIAIIWILLNIIALLFIFIRYLPDVIYKLNKYKLW